MSAFPERAKQHLATTVCMLGFAGTAIILKAMLNSGISMIVFSIYANILALVSLLPLAYFLEKGNRPPLSISVVVQFFFLGLVGVTFNQGLCLLGLNNISPTSASAITNSIPAITFLLAVILRQEQAHLNRKDGIAKVVGLVASITGTLFITLYKGPAIYGLNSHLRPAFIPGDIKGENWTLGCIYVIGQCFCVSGRVVLLKLVLNKYPARLSVASYTFYFGVLQFLGIAAVFERDSQAWLIQSFGELFSMSYTGWVALGFDHAIQIWVVDRAGPVFFSMHLPLRTLILAVIESIASGEEFYLGGIIGAALIVVGLYLIVWGKNQESQIGIEDSVNSRESSGNSSLVQTILD